MLRTNTLWIFFFQAEDGIRERVRSRGLGDVYKRQRQDHGGPPPAFGDPPELPRLHPQGRRVRHGVDHSSPGVLGDGGVPRGHRLRQVRGPGHRGAGLALSLIHI